LLAELGYEKLDDVIGRTEILKARNIQLAKTQLLDLSYLMAVCTCEQISHRILKDFQVFAYFFGHVSITIVLVATSLCEKWTVLFESKLSSTSWE
jgi:hypothetical protein